MSTNREIVELTAIRMLDDVRTAIQLKLLEDVWFKLESRGDKLVLELSGARRREDSAS